MITALDILTKLWKLFPYTVVRVDTSIMIEPYGTEPVTKYILSIEGYYFLLNPKSDVVQKEHSVWCRSLEELDEFAKNHVIGYKDLIL